MEFVLVWRVLVLVLLFLVFVLMLMFVFMLLLALGGRLVVTAAARNKN